MKEPERILDEAEALHLLELAVKDRGEDYVYRSEYDRCRYFVEQAPACIVGHVLDQMGFTEADLFVKGDRNAHDVNASAFNAIEVQGLTLTPKAELALNEAQWDQDTGRTWGAAVERAKSFLS